MCSVARRYELDPAQMYQWRKKFRVKDETPTMMLPVEVSKARPSSVSGPSSANTPDFAPDGRAEERIEITLKNGRHLFAPLDIDVKQLGRFVAMLEKA